MRQLDVFGVYRHSLKSLRDHLPFAFNISWPWMALILPFNIAANSYAVLNEPDYPEKMSAPLAFALITVGFLSFLAFASIAVSWHRYVLLDEVPQGWARFRLDETVWRYVGNVILLFLILAAPTIALSLAIAFVSSAVTNLLFIPLVGALVVGIMAFSFQLGIKLPAIALGRRDYKFNNATTDTAGNFWNFVGLTCLMLLTLLAFGLLLTAITFVLTRFATTPGLVFGIAIESIANWVSTVWNVTLLTSLYGFFVEKRDF